MIKEKEKTEEGGKLDWDTQKVRKNTHKYSHTHPHLEREARQPTAEASEYISNCYQDPVAGLLFII